MGKFPGEIRQLSPDEYAELEAYFAIKQERAAEEERRSKAHSTVRKRRR